MSKEQDRDYQPQPKVVEYPVHNPDLGFDARVQIKDAKTGKFIREQAHDLHIVGQSSYYEFPAGSGNLYEPSGKPAGRWEKQADGKMGASPDKEHVAIAEPVDADDLSAVQDENEALKAELAALKAESEKAASLIAKTEAKVEQKPALKK